MLCGESAKRFRDVKLGVMMGVVSQEGSGEESRVLELVRDEG